MLQEISKASPAVNAWNSSYHSRLYPPPVQKTGQGCLGTSRARHADGYGSLVNVKLDTPMHTAAQ